MSAAVSFGASDELFQTPSKSVRSGEFDDKTTPDYRITAATFSRLGYHKGKWLLYGEASPPPKIN
jgi:hypothetical protein